MAPAKAVRGAAVAPVVSVAPVAEAAPVAAAEPVSAAAPQAKRIPLALGPNAPALFRLASADPSFEPALTSLAMKPPADITLGEEEIPDAPFAGKAKPSRPAPVAVAPVNPAGAAASIPLPQSVDVLPRPRPPLTPAQELGLEGKERAKAEKCLATAIYFEARNEPVRGQVAVAQVVLNRVFSPYYPGDVCGVVYQNAHRRLACQFTFACDGIPDVVREKGPWLRAQRIAHQALDSQNWLPEVAKSTHYHATYVRPNWVREMRKMVKHGQHIFYRPYRWGDGADEAGWGVASLTHLTAYRPKVARN